MLRQGEADPSEDNAADGVWLNRTGHHQVYNLYNVTPVAGNLPLPRNQRCLGEVGSGVTSNYFCLGLRMYRPRSIMF